MKRKLFWLTIFFLATYTVDLLSSYYSSVKFPHSREMNMFGFQTVQALISQIVLLILFMVAVVRGSGKIYGNIGFYVLAHRIICYPINNIFLDHMNEYTTLFIEFSLALIIIWTVIIPLLSERLSKE